MVVKKWTNYPERYAGIMDMSLKRRLLYGPPSNERAVDSTLVEKGEEGSWRSASNASRKLQEAVEGTASHALNLVALNEL